MMNDPKNATAQNKQSLTVDSSVDLDKVIQKTEDLRAGFEQVSKGKSEADLVRIKEKTAAFVAHLLSGMVTVQPNALAMIDEAIAIIDEVVSNQLDEILHAPQFQQLESTWRGLFYLVDESRLGPMLQIKVLNASKKELARDLDRAANFNQSALFKSVYDDGFGRYEADPFGVLIGDYSFSHRQSDVGMLRKIAGVAAAAHAPFFAAADPELLGLDSYEQLLQRQKLSGVFSDPSRAQFASFRDSEDARYVGLVLPRMLLRAPYGPDGVPVDGFNYEETVSRTAEAEADDSHSKFCWGNPAYALAARMTDAMARCGWASDIVGPLAGGKVESLPTHTFMTDDGDLSMKCPVEIGIHEARTKELSQLGLIPLVHGKNKDYAAFFVANSVHRPQKYVTPEATANAELNADITYTLALCRFAHYIKVIMRDKLGQKLSGAQIEAQLQSWLGQYICIDPDARDAQKAKMPLAAGSKVAVAADPERPGFYKAEMFLKPHFRLKDIEVALKLVADLPERLT